MTHQIISINDYLHETTEIAKRNHVRRFVLTCTLFLACLSLGFGIYSSSEIVNVADNQSNTDIISVSHDNNIRFGKVYLAFDPDELNGIEDIDAYLMQGEDNYIHSENSGYAYPVGNWTEDEVRNQIVITGNYYAGQ